ncbi:MULTISPECIES: hypothetical protein [unclassified Bradyrhizobium]|uniref:hypothetical protein n=1 Tax=unclassified Bradyrhizobium TaxID=2631580 RepID=UPI0028E8EB33|nr:MULTISPECIES: hypothetical protein [unclassified Bradyrhizobium]
MALDVLRWIAGVFVGGAFLAIALGCYGCVVHGASGGFVWMMALGAAMMTVGTVGLVAPIPGHS